jgi:hypothetical protein
MAQQKSQASQIIATNPALTLGEIVIEAIRQGLPRISLSRLNQSLKVLLVTRKVMRTIPQMRNAPQTKFGQQLYCQWVFANQHFAVIYIDEFGFQIGTQRHFGRAPRRQTARRITPLTRFANVSVCLAVSASHGLLYHDFSVGTFDRDCFKIFMNSLAEEIASQQIASPCFILDTCPIHNIKDVPEASEMFGEDFNFLSLYSPMPNPVEGCIGDVK